MRSELTAWLLRSCLLTTAVLGVATVAAPTVVRAQTRTTATVQGTVRAADGSAPVEQVLVGLVGTTLSATTDAAGRFTLAVPTDQALVLEARRVGFAPQRLPVAAFDSRCAG